MDKVALITGASSGIGWSLAKLFAADRWSVGLLGRRKELLQKLADEISAASGKAMVLPCDITDHTAVVAAVQACENQLGAIDCLIANAGVGGPSHPHSFDSVISERIVRTNLLGPIYCLEAVLPGMLKRRSGHIVGISSLASYRGLPGSAVYCATKSGLNTLLESLRISLRHENIAVSIICPGYVRTPMTANNQIRMPFLLEQEDAAKRIYLAILRKKKFFAFPWQLALMMRIAQALPAGIYDRAVERARGRRS